MEHDQQAAIETLETSQQPFTVKAYIGADEPLLDQAAALASAIIGANQRRSADMKPILAARVISVELVPVSLNEQQQHLLSKASFTRYTEQDPFLTPAEVREYFSPAIMEMIGVPGLDEAELRAMAEVVITTRAHCAF